MLLTGRLVGFDFARAHPTVAAQDWQWLGMVKSLSEGLKFSMNDHPPLINATIADMSDRFFDALERRL
ncbi:MAG: hypothetical protein RIB93_01880 [Coleofasciculus sp. D1-CHI-01]|uniref:hypothetical protein n=1 Tax=Coleofasciculus sp. D1-CHI-01 TaxID=3068482 RepID=UPI003301B88C